MLLLLYPARKLAPAHPTMPEKTFFKDGQALVVDSLQGLCSVSPELIFNRNAKGETCTASMAFVL